MKSFWVLVLSLIVIALNADMQVLSISPRIYLIPDFLTSEECETIIQLAGPYLQRSTVVDEDNANDAGVLDFRRTSEGMFLPQKPTDKTLKEIELRIAELTGLPKENGEALHVLRYDMGAEYVPHHDYFNPSTPGGILHLNRGGQRVASVIMYLNTPEDGGETIFPHVNLAVKPEKGTALLFYNCLLNGEIDPLSLHGGAPVKAGEKWIATRWIRTGEFH